MSGVSLPCVQVLRKGDVLMEFDGTPIANDGTVPFRARERIFFTALTTLKPTGSTARVKVRRGLKHQDVVAAPLDALLLPQFLVANLVQAVA